MQAFPHHYQVSASGEANSLLTVSSTDLANFTVSAPPEFGGDHGFWSPETLLVASISSCFILTFRAIARASKLDWEDLTISATGELDKTADGLRFTKINLVARLTIADNSNSERADKLLIKAESGCLITNSLNCDIQLETQVAVK